MTRRLVVAAKAPLGGVDAVMVSGRPPMFFTSKFAVALWPTSTLLKSRVVGTSESIGAGAAPPARGTPKSPMLV